jgi:hypothetical protein
MKCFGDQFYSFIKEIVCDYHFINRKASSMKWERRK